MQKKHPHYPTSSGQTLNGSLAEDDAFIYRAYFDLTLPILEAFERLKPHIVPTAIESCLTHARRLGGGTIQRLDFPLVNDLGAVTLKDNQLLLESLSQTRFAQGQALLLKALSGSLTLQHQETTSFEEEYANMLAMEDRDEDFY